MIYVPNGAGLETREGFSTPEGSGYVIRKSGYGCSSGQWPFADVWNYTATLTTPSGPSAFGPYWTYYPPSGHDGSVAAANNGVITTDRSGVMAVGCPNLPVLTSMYAQALWVGSDHSGFNVSSGGPMIFVGQTVSVYRIRGYAMRLVNKVVTDHSLNSSTTRIDLLKVLWTVGGSDGGSVLANAVFPLDTGASNNGPMGSSHVMKITGEPESGNLRLKCFIDGTQYISFLESGGFTSGIVGMEFGGTLTAGPFVGGSL